MGCCQSKSKYGAFRHDLDAPLLDDVASKVNQAEARVFIVRLASMEAIPVGDPYNGNTDAYAELKLSPNDAIAGQQKQVSSIKPTTLSPKWDPPERFQFIVSKADSRVVISVYHFNLTNPKDSKPLGDAVLKLKEITAQGTAIPKSLKLIGPKDGKVCGEVNVIVTNLSIPEAMSIQEHTVYEFERWSPVHGWGSTEAHFLPTDPPKWCSEDGKKFGKTIEQVCPAMPTDAGWAIHSNWHTISTDFDPEGWQYAISCESPYWFAKGEGSTYVVRRRTWHREIRRSVEEGDRASTNSTSSASGRRKRMF